MADDYTAAQKLAQKEYRTCVAKGCYPYLPALEDFLSQEQISAGTSVGLVQIPAQFVVGTRSAARSNLFARNFMPLANEQSEFGIKWKQLCQAHLDEGIRDPVKVYEYMNRFYVAEGNKRVSVLKYFGTVNLPAQVTRILPERTGSEEVERYYAFLDFSRHSGINNLECSRTDSYALLTQLTGKRPDEDWSDLERSRFSSTFYYFQQAYDACGGRRLTILPGDAMLVTMQIYGYQELAGKTAAEIRKLVEGIWEEITLQQEEPSIDVKLDPATAKTGLLAKVLPKSEPKVLRVAFVHDKSPELSGWTNGHEKGRLHVERVFGKEVQTSAYFYAVDQGPDETIRRAIDDGNTVLFTTSPCLTEASLRAAVEHPKLTILNCSLNQSHRYIRTYYARMYEAKFIAGVIAGSLSRIEDVGYICDYPIFGQVAGINAFALGVQTVNPCARVRLEWSSVGGVEAAAKRLQDAGVSLISSQDLTRLRDDGRTPFGLSRCTADGQIVLAKPVWQWGVYYERMLRRIRDKRFQAEYEESRKALNYYWGMSAGVVQMRYHDALPSATLKLARLVERSISNGLCDPFRGPLFDQNGRQIIGPEQSLCPDQVIDMHWLSETVVGAIPPYDQLTETGKATVRAMGFLL